jgi:hypothetical protein
MINPPYFEIHIRPMFRLIDQNQMASRFDLFDYEQVRAKAVVIAGTLKEPLTSRRLMPKLDWGGPWPEEWIRLFERWISAGCPRLPRSTGTYSLSKTSSKQFILTVQASLQDGAEAAWVEREWTAPDIAEYTLLKRPAPDGVTKPPRVVKFKLVVEGDQVAQVFINDAAGRQLLTVS